MKKKIVLIGMMGSGKTTVGKILSKILKLNFIDTDKPGFWEGYGYHMYGAPWKEQRYYND